MFSMQTHVEDIYQAQRCCSVDIYIYIYMTEIGEEHLANPDFKVCLFVMLAFEA